MGVWRREFESSPRPCVLDVPGSVLGCPNSRASTVREPQDERSCDIQKPTGDIKWPAWTHFAQALGPLAGSFPLLSLRTNKANVVVGIDRQVAERLDQSGEKWRVSGRYALISFLQATC
ncbi:hypothetical protein F5887DRAFT_51743 [Amanita rubescens]|nr:hypothetical protein F5887DRAFT_51743 [Amanita rubescens]